MRVFLISCLVSLVLPAAALAQAEADAPRFSPQEVRAHVEFLADDLLEGRDAGTRGHEIAARYVAGRFAALGLKPAGSDGGWYQQVTLAEYGLDAGKPASISIGGRRFSNGVDVLVAASPRFGETTQTVSGGAVFVGFGREEDYAGLNVAGKFAVALVGEPKGADANPLADEDKAAAAARRGAIGLLYLLTPAALADFDWDQATGYFGAPQSNWLDAEGFPAGQKTGLKIGAYMRGAAATALFAGAPMSASQVYTAAAAGPVRGFALPATVATARTSRVRAFKSPNVVALLPGSDPALASEYVVLSAHLDHVGTDTALTGDTIFNGAMDNAAGVATMLEAARAFATSGTKPRRSILFVALTAEEDGLLGSDYLANNPVAGAGKLVANVNLDMPILLYDFTDVIAFGGEHSTIGEIVARAGASMGVSVSPDPMPEEQFFVRSDHYSFVKKGVPSIFLMTGFANGGREAFRGFLATNYHKVSDQLSLPFNWEAGAKFADLNYRIAREIADADQAPRWYEGNMFGDRFAPDAPRAKKP